MSDFYREYIDTGFEYCFEEGYEHWTVSDVLEILSEYPLTAKVWVYTGSKYRPMETISGSDRDVDLG